MKVFIAHYEKNYFGGGEEKDYVTTAETEDVALGLILEKCPETKSEDWKITPIDTNNSGVIYIHEREW